MEIQEILQYWWGKTVFVLIIVIIYIFIAAFTKGYIGGRFPKIRVWLWAICTFVWFGFWPIFCIVWLSQQIAESAKALGAKNYQTPHTPK